MPGAGSPEQQREETRGQMLVLSVRSYQPGTELESIWRRRKEALEAVA